GHVVCAGANEHGQGANGTVVGNSVVPAHLAELTPALTDTGAWVSGVDWLSRSGKSAEVCAFRPDLDTRCWGQGWMSMGVLHPRATPIDPWWLRDARDL